MKVKRNGALLALATIVVLTLVFRWYFSLIENIPTPDVYIERLPLTLGEWTGQDTIGLDLRSRGILRLDRYVKRSYTNKSGETVILYIGYWRKQTGDYQAAKHSPALCLPSNGWRTSTLPPIELNLESGSLIKAKRILGENRDHSQLFYYWFMTGAETYTEEWQTLVRISLQTFFAGRSDGAIIEISTPLVGTGGKKEQIKTKGVVIESFLKSLYPELQRLINSQP